jgi:fatty-acid desaturase
MSSNPHVLRIHLPAHLLGVVGIILFWLNPSWLFLLGFLVCNFWFSGLGMSIGFHRYFTHRSFKTSRFWHYVMLTGGCLAGQGSPVFWVALHRLHHPNSDTAEDIHSPRYKGLWNGYMGWIFSLNPALIPMARAGDLIRDPVMRFIHRNYDKLLWSYWTILAGVSLVNPTLLPLIAGMLVAGMVSIHQEAVINSICHDSRFGCAPHEAKTGDGSRNVPWLHWLTWGQSMHNNHHADAGNPNFGSEGSKDIGYRIIRVIQIKE